MMKQWHQFSIINLHSLDFEMLESGLPLYQYGLGIRLTYESTFAGYSNVTKSATTDVSYTISNISLEFDTVTNPSLAGQIRTGKAAFYMTEFLDPVLFRSIIPTQAFSGY